MHKLKFKLLSEYQSRLYQVYLIDTRYIRIIKDTMMQIECYENSVECVVFAVMPPAVTVITWTVI